ncbi:MAG: aminomethyl-transferring glycine dehydrogenase subunit GcvPB [Firmicutes bacterium]|nr:aminomethyl-transferring glycine dehydrogenase subunit GcvPB [Bacillota bacterium]
MGINQQFPLLMELGSPGRRAYSLPKLDVPSRPIEDMIPRDFLRQDPASLPELSELEVVRHYTGLSRRNHGVDVGFYPLGSCTMKYNPKVNEDLAFLPGFASIHPYQPEETVQGALQLMYQLEQALCEIAGLDRATLSPAAGAHGELTGLMLIKAYHEAGGEGHRNEIVVPDAAHGTNPASAAMCGYKIVEVPSNDRGGVSVEHLKGLIGPKTAGLMLTNPNTLGLFEEEILTISELVHAAGGLLYYDGANANAILGKCRPGDMGFDVVHFNIHKTFSTPHGGGGPGSGPIAVRDILVPFLPTPTVEVGGSDEKEFFLHYDRPQSIGQVKGFYGNFLVLVRAYGYIRSMGSDGLRQASEDAVLSANYLMEQLKDIYHLPYDRVCKHEFVLSATNQKKQGVTAQDIAKRLLDYNIHAPTVYFPLIVEEALMIEPTETESKAELDRFIDVMVAIAREVTESPEQLRTAPHHTVVGRLDETQAARHPIVRWHAPNSDAESLNGDE